jgi:hypothetical protein
MGHFYKACAPGLRNKISLNKNYFDSFYCHYNSKRNYKPPLMASLQVYFNLLCLEADQFIKV